MIVTALNYNEFYVKQLHVLLESLATNSPNDKISVYLVDFPQEKILSLQNKYPNYDFIDEKITILDKSDDKKRGFMVCYRATVMLRQLKKTKSPVAWFDTDLIIRKDLKGFWENITPNTLQIMVRKDAPERSIFQAGVFGIGYSNKTVQYITEWENIITKKNTWYMDQLQLYKLYKKYDINLVKMNRIYNDVGGKDYSFADKSCIWHCKSSHMNNPIFKKEWNMYYENSSK